MGPTRCRAALADLDDANGPRAAWSSPGAPHRGGGLLASEPGLVTGTHDLARTIGVLSVVCPPVGPGMSRSETADATRPFGWSARVRWHGTRHTAQRIRRLRSNAADRPPVLRV